MRRHLTLAAAAIVMLLGLAAPAAADHAPPVLAEPVVGECGQTVLLAELPAEPHGSYAGAALVVQYGGDQEVTGLGTPLTVGPFTEDTTIRYRVWGGGERDYDSPQLADLDALVAYLGEHPGGELDIDAPGAAWHELTVTGCPVEQPTDPATEPSEPANPTDPATEPSEPADPTEPPAAVPTAVPAGVTGPTGYTPGVIGLLAVMLAAAAAALIRHRRRPGKYRA